MKKSLVLALTTAFSGLLTVAAPAQTISNQAFEDWAMRRGIEVPVGWQTSDDLVEEVVPPYARVNSGTVTKTTDAHSGQYAAKLSSIYRPTQGSIPLFGLLALGTSFQFMASTSTTYGGEPYTQRPARLQFYYKLSGPQALADEPLAQVLLTRCVSGQTINVAYGEYRFPALAAAYTLASAPLFYLSGLTPDSVHVNIWSGTTSPVTDGTTLLIDDLALVGGTVTAARAPGGPTGLTAFPNPSADGRFALAATEPVWLAAPLTVTDLAGREVLRAAAGPPLAQRLVDLHDQPPGIYSLQLATPQGVVVCRLVVK